jgi:hypothetical protein
VVTAAPVTRARTAARTVALTQEPEPAEIA